MTETKKPAKKAAAPKPKAVQLNSPGGIATDAGGRPLVDAGGRPRVKLPDGSIS